MNVFCYYSGPPHALSHCGGKTFQKGAISRPFEATSFRTKSRLKKKSAIIYISGVDPPFVIRGGPNPEYFLSNLRKLLKRGKFFLTTQSLIVKRN